ncbi:MAG: MFS transporter [Gammaproteobacteria bacterium]
MNSSSNGETINLILHKPLLLALMLAVFLDIGNFFMPMPVYTPLFLHSSLLQGFSYKYKAVLLGILISCYGLGQIFGALFFGGLSDQWGRKKVILISLFISFIGCVLGGISITFGLVNLIYISRVLMGLSSGSIAVIFALTADYSNKKNRAKNLGYINIGIALGAAIGAVIGGYLITTETIIYSHYAVPFYFMAILYLINIFLLTKLLPLETSFCIKESTNFYRTHLNRYKALTYKKLLNYLILVGLLFQLSAESFYLVAPILAVKVFHTSPSDISEHFFVQGIIAAITSLFLNKLLSQHFTSSSIYSFCSLFLIISLLFLFIRENYLYSYIPFFGMGIFGTLCWIHLNNLFSQSVDKSDQGFIFGISQSLWAIGGIVSGALVGLVAASSYKLCIFIPLIFIIGSFILTIVMKKNYK